MDAIDTNVLVRYYLDDDKEQAELSQRLIENFPIYVPKTVILELEWVLRGVAKIDRNNIINCYQHLLSLPNAEFENRQEIASALRHYKLGLDFADAIHLASSENSRRFITFDNKGFAKRANRIGCLPPVHVLDSDLLAE
jgi:predicted nucleic-acid-binding protein